MRLNLDSDLTEAHPTAAFDYSLVIKYQESGRGVSL